MTNPTTTTDAGRKLGKRDAYPFTHTQTDGGTGQQFHDCYPGMSIRTWMVGQVAAGLLADPDVAAAPPVLADSIVEIADAILARLAATEEVDDVDS